ncbi:adenylate kinase [Pelagicoccus sp. NFK12]|uniref:Adenylate kinase n=1 Tax=Pelagicoccus enzymogenes TaxID=2773457 RepID=A0A927FAW5_9BACT|nr:adenylate kinase [Pelagicoccus enzymogenes]MBD5781718.1 adenylate kinase [Pelagicoccus enzymogenes]
MQPRLSNSPPKRINVIGCSGSGKSTFARKLARRIEARYVELDSVYWGPNWTEPSDEELFQNLNTELLGESWVLDGNYSRTVPVKWKRVQSVIWLDTPFLTTLAQAFRRAIERAWTKEEIWPGTGNRESFRKSFFSRDSVLLWTLTSYRPLRKRYLGIMKDPSYAHIEFVQLRGHAKANAYLERIRSSAEL